MKFKNGAFGVLRGTTSCNPGESTKISLHGNNGTLVLQDREFAKYAVSRKEAARAEPKEIKLGSAKSEGVSDPKAIGKSGHIAQVSDLANAIRRNRDPMVSAESARKPVALILAIYESARTGRPVNLDTFRDRRREMQFGKATTKSRKKKRRR